MKTVEVTEPCKRTDHLPRSFSFLPGGVTGTREVTPEDLYTREKPWGFVTEANRRADPMLQIPELNAGFDAFFWYRDRDLTRIAQDASGCYVDSPGILSRLHENSGRRIPLTFKADVPQWGNYKVRLKLFAAVKEEELLIFLGRRRLFYRGKLSAGEELETEFLLNICDIIPRGRKMVYPDYSAEITLVGNAPRLVSAEICPVQSPVLYIAGDSTVTDQSGEYPYAPGSSYCGWGQMLSAFTGSLAAVSNHAHSGLTTESFRSEGHYQIILNHIQKGDYCLFQFGHNDQKMHHLKAEEGYRNNLVTYIKEIRAKEASPILVTPLARNSWRGSDGSYNDLLQNYALVCKEIGEQMKVPVVDLHGKSMDFVRNLGLEEAKLYYFPGDFTHSNDYGAYKMAGFVAEDLLEQLRACLKIHSCHLHAPLSGIFAPNSGYVARYAPFIRDKSPTKCDAQLPESNFKTRSSGGTFGKTGEKPANEWIPERNISLPRPPANWEGGEDPADGKELFRDLTRPEEWLTRAEAMDLVIQAMNFFPVNVYNDMFEDVAGHEWYAGTIECAYQNGMIPQFMVREKKIFPDKAVTLREFLRIAMTGYQCRKRLPVQPKKQQSLKKCSRKSETIHSPLWEEEEIQAARAMGIAAKEADLDHFISRKNAAAICKTLYMSLHHKGNENKEDIK